LTQLIKDLDFHKQEYVMFYKLNCLILSLWALRNNLYKVMFDVAEQSAFKVLMLSEALFCRYTQAYDAQHVDQSNYRRVSRPVCPVVGGSQVLLTVEGHLQRRCIWGWFAYVDKSCADRIIFSGCCSSAICK